MSVVASFIILHGRAGTPVVSMGDVVARALVITFFCQSCMYLLDLYNFRLSQTWGEMLFALAIAIGFVCIGIGLLSYAIPKFGVAGKMYYLSILIASFFLLLWRFAFELYITRFAPQENILIVGTGEVARQVGEEVRKRKRLGFHLVGFINAPPTRNDPSAAAVGDVLGDPAQMDRIIEQTRRRQDRRGDHGTARRVPRQGNACASGERVPGGRVAGILREAFRKDTDRQPCPFLFHLQRRVPEIQDSSHAPAGRQRDRGRRTPGSPPAGLSRRGDPHQARFSRSRLYSQIRVGQNNKPIRIYKFRSMRNDAEKNGDAVWAVENDPRITRVGHFLRKTRIDELPQLFNVLIGELDFVGPRPERPEFVEKLQTLIPYYDLRHTVTPGITGWAQVMFHYGSTIDESKEKLQYDLFYIKNMSLKLDLLILFHTFKIVLLGRGAR